MAIATLSNELYKNEAENNVTANKPNRRVHGLVVAAGIGNRFGGQHPKQYTRIAGKTILEHGLAQLAYSRQLEHLYLVVAPDDDRVQQIIQQFSDSSLPNLPITLVNGGKERWQSVQQGVITIANTTANPEDLILIHDAARPCVAVDDICRLVNVAHQQDYGAILATPVVDTLKKADANGQIKQTIKRQGLWQAQTPQVFRLKHLQDVLRHVAKKQLHITDEASGFEQLGLPIQMVEGSRSNIKLTYPSDLQMLESLLPIVHTKYADTGNKYLPVS